jgi:hypothetical protein
MKILILILRNANLVCFGEISKKKFRENFLFANIFLTFLFPKSLGNRLTIDVFSEKLFKLPYTFAPVLHIFSRKLSGGIKFLRKFS